MSTKLQTMKLTNNCGGMEALPDQVMRPMQLLSGVDA